MLVGTVLLYLLMVVSFSLVRLLLTELDPVMTAHASIPVVGDECRREGGDGESDGPGESLKGISKGALLVGCLPVVLGSGL